MLFWALIASLMAASLIVALMRWLPEMLTRYTLSHFGSNETAVPQIGRYSLIAVSAALGIVAIFGSFFAPYPALWGLVVLLPMPTWESTQRRNRTEHAAPVVYGLQTGRAVLYVLAAIATFVGVIRISPNG